MKKLPDPARKELVYRWLNGFIKIGGGSDQLTAEQMQIAFLTEQIYQHRLNLCNRSHLDFENKDMEAIIDAYESLNWICADVMYDQGWFDADHAAQK